ncbi:MAG: TIM barrel protein, partial [Phycisphaerae bacterium]
MTMTCTQFRNGRTWPRWAAGLLMIGLVSALQAAPPKTDSLVIPIKPAAKPVTVSGVKLSERALAQGPEITASPAKLLVTATTAPVPPATQPVETTSAAAVRVAPVATSQPAPARDAAGLQIPSVVIATHWTHPLSSPNPTMRATGLEGLRQGLRDAKAYGASSVLLVPGVVNKDISYDDAYSRSFAEIQKAVPLAESLGVAIAIENVWNKFLLSPREAAAYVDAFKSPAVKWHFDVGNVGQRA